MTREEAIEVLERIDKFYYLGGELFNTQKEEAISMAIEALKAQDRPIICPRCGRTFSEAEGRERDK